MNMPLCEWTLVIPDEGPDVFHTDCGEEADCDDEQTTPTHCPHCGGRVEVLP